MLVLQNHTTRNYVNSITLTNKKTDLIFTDTLSVKVTFQQAVNDNANWTFLITFALPKKTFVFFNAI